MCCAPDMPCGARGDFYHIESRSDISILRSKNIEVAIGEHIDKRRPGMSDWRLNGQEDYLSNLALYKVSFPEFWQTAYKDRNTFYQKIERYAKRHVETTGRGCEYLDGEKIQHFWHEPCEFCWEKALTDKPCEFYCTEDMRYWICAECFRDFFEQFHWQVRPAEELFTQPHDI